MSSLLAPASITCPNVSATMRCCATSKP